MYDVWISRQAHTITVLVVFSCILVYVTLFEEETYGADYNNKRYILWFLWFTRKNWGEVQVEYNIWFLICIEVESRFQIQGQGHTKNKMVQGHVDLYKLVYGVQYVTLNEFLSPRARS